MKAIYIISILVGVLFSANYTFATSTDSEEYVNKTYEQAIKNSNILREYLTNNQDQIIGIEYISAAGTSESIMSRFGHSMLRFIDRDNNYANDIVLSIEANVAEENIHYLKGINGDYDVLPRFDLLQNFWVNYVRHQSRPLERFIIPTNKEMRTKIIEEILRVSQDPKTLKDYTFFNRNCAGLLAQVLLNTGITFKNKGINARVPVLFDSWLKKSLLTPFASIRSLSPFIVFKKAYKSLNIPKDNKLNDYELWTDDSISNLKKDLSKKEILFLYNELWDLPYEIGKKVLKNNKYNSDMDFYDTIGMTTLPSEIYQLCESNSCAQKLASIESSIWNSNIIKKNNKKRVRILKRVLRRKSNIRKFNKTETLQSIKNNYQLLINNQEGTK